MNVFMHNLRKYERRIFVCVLALIVASANTPDTWGSMTNMLWWPVHLLGVEVPMTPVTADMTFTTKADTALVSMSRPIALAMETAKGVTRVSGRDLDFHRFRLPSQIMIENMGRGGDVRGPLLAACAELEVLAGERVVAWTAESPPPTPGDADLGFNRRFVCPWYEVKRD